MNPPAGLTVNPALPSAVLAGGQSYQAGVAFTAASGFHGNHTITLRLSSNEGVTCDFPIQVEVRPLMPHLVVNPESLKASVLRGEQKSISFTVTNAGGLTTGPLDVLLPALPWLQPASPGSLAALEPGASASVTLLLAPSADVGLTLYNGSLVIDPAAGSSLNVPFAFRVVSGRTGDLQIEAVDEAYYFTAAAPRVQGATVTLRDAISAEQVRTADTAADGRVSLTGIPEGWYSLEVDSPQHTRWAGNLYVNAGETTFRQIFISREYVSYTWKVEEVEIQDHYKISVETTFETNVPAPVVTVTPSVLDVEDLTELGQTKVINFTIENHGLIAANNGNFGFDKHPFYEVTPLIEDVGTIPAKSALTIPVTVKRIGVFAEDGSIITLGQTAAKSGRTFGVLATPAPVSCSLQGHFELDYICGFIPVPKFVVVPGSGVQGNCRGGPGEPGNPGGPGGAGGGTIGPDVSFTTPKAAECSCLIPLCVGGSEKVNLGSVGDAIAAALSRALPPWIRITDVDVELGADGELCICCEDGDYGLKGHGSGHATITASGVIGFDGGGEVSVDAGGWTNVSANVSALAGARATVTGSVEITIDKECNEEGSVCLTGSLELDAFAGIEVDGEASATWTVPNTSIGVAYSGTARGAIGINGFARASVTGCIDGTVKYEACASLTPEVTLQLDLKATGYPDATLGGSLKLPVFEAGDCASETAPAAVRAKVRALPRATGPEPVRFEVPGSSYRVPDEEIIARAFQGNAPSGGVCAQVKIRLDQQAITTRTAFRASLDLSNNQESAPLTEVGFDLDVRNATTGEQAGDMFNVQVSKLTGLAAIDGSGQIGAKTTGAAQWTLIPRDTAAPLADTRYTIGGTIRYNQGGTLFSIPVTPVTITVRPDAALYLKYFHQRDVFSDDPHTDPVEPAVPYALAVMVENRGAGAARNLTITSAEPKIVDNEKGLLVDFKIVGTEVAGENLTPSLTANFGLVSPGQRKVATWLMTSSLQGLFTEYKATFEHLDGFGDPRISLIKEVEIHEMIHMIEAQGSRSDGKPDFLVNDVADIKDRPDTVHLSDGTTAPVTVVESATLSAVPTLAQPVVTLTTGIGPGWSYLRIPEPSNGTLRLTRVQRSDGLEIPLDKNVWVTDRTFIGLGLQPIRENILHLADADSTGTYTLTYGAVAGQDVTPPSSTVASLPAQSGADISVRWSGTDDSGISSFDVYVRIDSGAWQPWLTRTDRTSSLYQGAAGKSYDFYCVAVDLAGNAEVQAPGSEASTVVSLMNAAPSVAGVGALTVAEGGSFRYQIVATDPDGGAAALRYSLQSTVPGVVIDQTGLVRWVTGEADGGRFADVVVTVTDGGSPAASSQRSFRISVDEVNTAPVLQPVGSVSVEAGKALSVPVAASDSDLPVQSLSFSLGAAPAGMTIHPLNGRLAWTPPLSEAGKSFRVEVIATDSGTPSASSSAEFSVSVLTPPDRAPVFAASPVFIWFAGESRAATVSATDPDGDLVSLAASLATLPGSPTFSAAAGMGTGQFTWAVPSGTRGIFQIPLTATAASAQTAGVLTIRVEPRGPYWEWAAEVLANVEAPAEQEMQADPDGDGLENVFEMAFLLAPLVPDFIPSTIRLDGPVADGWYTAKLSIKRRRGSQDLVTIRPQYTDNLTLESWLDIPVTDWDVVLDPAGDSDNNLLTEEIEINILAPPIIGSSQKRQFYRIRAAMRPAAP